MKFKVYFSILVIFFVAKSNAAPLKELNPVMMVYGSDITAFTAAIQAARSNVATLWVMDANQFVKELTSRPVKITMNDNLNGGIWMDVLMGIALSKKTDDSLANVVKNDINPRLAMNVIEKMVSEQFNLTVIKNSDVESLTATRKGWSVLLKNKKKYDFRAVVDASDSGVLKEKVVKGGITLREVSLHKVQDMSAEQVRTIVALGEYNRSVFGLSLKDLLARSFNNLFFTNGLVSAVDDVNAIPLNAHIGQAVGVAAAYCAFFKTEVDKIDVRKLQSELLTFGARLLPWQDVVQKDPNYSAIQRFYLVSILKGVERDGKVVFGRDDSVSVASIKPVFNQLYSRSQLWFLDHKEEYFKAVDLFSFIKMISFRGDEVDEQVKNDWRKKLYFKTEYAPGHIVNRYEFAALIDRYANPFSKKVTQDGVILR